MKRILLFLMLCSALTQSQWKYETAGNDFDGKFKVAYVIGKGYEFPYTKPALVVNYSDSKGMSIYIRDIGYTGCDRNTIRISFGEGTVYSVDDPSTDLDNEALFISNVTELTKLEFVEKIMNKSKMSIRFTSSCGSKDFEFPLGGSTKALNFVLKDWLEPQRESAKEFDKKYNDITSYYKDLGCGEMDMKKSLHSVKSKGTDMFHTESGSKFIEHGMEVNFYRNDNYHYPILVETIAFNGDVDHFGIQMEEMKMISDDIGLLLHYRMVEAHLLDCNKKED